MNVYFVFCFQRPTPRMKDVSLTLQHYACHAREHDVRNRAKGCGVSNWWAWRCDARHITHRGTVTSTGEACILDVSSLAESLVLNFLYVRVSAVETSGTGCVHSRTDEPLHTVSVLDLGWLCPPLQAFKHEYAQTPVVRRLPMPCEQPEFFAAFRAFRRPS